MSANGCSNIDVGASKESIRLETTKEVTLAKETESVVQQGSFRLSKQRWLVLAAMALFGLITTALGEFRAILSTMLELLGLSTEDYIYIKQLFMYLPALTSIPTGWFIDRYGLKATMYLATLLMLISNGFRFLMFRPELANWHHFRLAYWIISGFAATQAAGIYFCTPLKVSENWFSESERSVAWTVLITSYNVGTSAASFLLPRFVGRVSEVHSLAYVNLISGLVVTLVIVSCITRSKPKHPPSERMVRSSKQSLPWLKSIYRILKNRDIVLHTMHETIFESLSQAAHSVIQMILVRSGHSKVFVGDVLSINYLLSVAMMIGLAALVHRMSDITITCKVASVARAVTFILHLYLMLYPVSDSVVMVSTIAYVVCKCWAMPNNNNMTAHLICGTVSEATITAIFEALYLIFASICSVAFMKFMIKDTSHQEDYTYSIAMVSVICLLNSVIYVIFFKGQAAEQDGVVDNAQSNHNTIVLELESRNNVANRANQRHALDGFDQDKNRQ